MSGRLAALALLCTSCFVDPGTQTAGETSIGASSEPATTTAPTSTGTLQPTTGTTSTSTTDPATTSTSTSTTDPATTTDPTTTTGDTTACEAISFRVVLLVEDATVTAPMAKYQSQFGEGTVAYSEIAEQGAITFDLELPCAGPHAVWGRVLDPIAGVQNSDPDSFYIRSDDADELTWYYGCQTAEAGPGYTWQRVRSIAGEGMVCDIAEDWTLDLSAGAHTITLRNREAASADNQSAAVARLLVTNDLAYVPGASD